MSHFFCMTKKSWQKFKYLENRKSFSGETKSIFIIFKEFSVIKNCETLKCTFKFGYTLWNLGFSCFLIYNLIVGIRVSTPPQKHHPPLSCQERGGWCFWGGLILSPPLKWTNCPSPPFLGNPLNILVFQDHYFQSVKYGIQNDRKLSTLHFWGSSNC